MAELSNGDKKELLKELREAEKLLSQLSEKMRDAAGSLEADLLGETDMFPSTSQEWQSPSSQEAVRWLVDFLKRHYRITEE